jgi:hypothetical protein
MKPTMNKEKIVEVSDELGGRRGEKNEQLLPNLEMGSVVSFMFQILTTLNAELLDRIARSGRGEGTERAKEEERTSQRWERARERPPASSRLDAPAPS